MIRFTLLPERHAPLGAEVRYGVEADTAQTIDLRVKILEGPDAGRIAGARRFVGVAAAESDLGPILRRALRYEPTVGATGLRDADGRTVMALVEAEGSADDLYRSIPRTLLPGYRKPVAPMLLTSMPRERLLAPGEADELTLFATGPCTIRVSAPGCAGAAERSFGVAAAGLHLFRLAADDFAGADRITVDADEAGTVAYTLLPAPEGAIRLAWRSREGSIEHYTFPVERQERCAVVRTEARDTAGAVVTVAAGEEWRTTVVSAHEPRAVRRALAGILSAPQVWRVEEGVYRPVAVCSGECTTHCYGAVPALEVTFRPTPVDGGPEAPASRGPNYRNAVQCSNVL